MEATHQIFAGEGMSECTKCGQWVFFEICSAWGFSKLIEWAGRNANVEFRRKENKKQEHRKARLKKHRPTHQSPPNQFLGLCIPSKWLCRISTQSYGFPPFPSATTGRQMESAVFPRLHSVEMAGGFPGFEDRQSLAIISLSYFSIPCDLSSVRAQWDSLLANIY